MNSTKEVILQNVPHEDFSSTHPLSETAKMQEAYSATKER